MMFSIRSFAIRWQIHDILTAKVRFALSLTVYEIFANQIESQKFDLENEGKGQEGMEMFDSI